MTENDVATELNEFIESWNDNSAETKKAFMQLKTCLEGLEGVKFDFKSRPGVSFSLRAAHENQTERSLFVMVDVIDDDPAQRWLSVCFYGDMLTDPEEKGDLIPEGLMGDDGYCFDLDEWDEGDVAYLEARLTEACGNAAK